MKEAVVGQGQLVIGHVNKIIKIATATLAVIFCLIITKEASAASLYFSPSFDSKKIGSNFSVTVYVSSADQAINAASGVVSYDQNKLELVSLGQGGSIFSLWVEQPSFSQAAGTFRFEGVILNPGFKGTKGKILTANFRAKALGTAEVRFSSGSSLANNGLGTNVLSSMGSASFNVITGEATPVPKEPVKPVAPQEVTTISPEPTPKIPTSGSVPAKPNIFSVTHSDEARWYNSSSANLAWYLPSGITTVALSLSDKNNSVPSVIYQPPITDKVVDNLTSGVWYFAARFKNQVGWSQIARYQLKVDLEAPKNFVASYINSETSSDKQARLNFKASDDLSGIDYYQIKIVDANQFPELIATTTNDTYVLDQLIAGKKSLLAEVYDLAGNVATTTLEFEFNCLNYPIINQYPKILESGQELLIGGLTYPLSDVTLWLQLGENKTRVMVRSDALGGFTHSYGSKLPFGDYQLWAEVTDQTGQKSPPSPRLAIKVNKGPLITLSSFRLLALDILIGLVIVAALLLLLALAGWSWHKLTFFRFKNRYQKWDVGAPLNYLRDVLKYQMKLLAGAQTNRRLTREERLILNKTAKELLGVETAIKKDSKKGIKRS